MSIENKLYYIFGILYNWWNSIFLFFIGRYSMYFTIMDCFNYYVLYNKLMLLLINNDCF